MMFTDLIFLSAIIVAATLATVFLLQVQTGGDPKKLQKVPVKTPVAAAAVLCLLGTGTQWVLSNMDAAGEAAERRAYSVATQIEAQVSLRMGTEGAEPFIDLSGSTSWADEDLLRALGSGEEVTLTTASGKPAAVKLTALEGSSFVPVLTYDGDVLDVFDSDSVEARNTKGFPQFLPAPELPAS
ncbi:hypothetical protein [Arthrobacter caoxuetaonis]|uniref:Uncharacterized protein n=1 Tax=Arthrobacter caoxuetaonis TaxID=2886935 RepID=A0A9X1MI76_9MICC|nr:hypothetical protein [Arthrobacter caoxuetaonis]MCC3299792.1 hypothetical protein [Arthrobacter caoxuetaonis]USQ59308.1 hypothetical protein NF551_17130 [Arthrobacter caoxuetaonis]